MAYATLKKNGPRRLNTQGVLFERGHRVPVGQDVAEALADDDRFTIELDDGEAQAAPAKASGDKRPADKHARLAAIAEATSQLDVDDQTHWTTDGKPDARALTSILGWQVTSNERDEALADASASSSVVAGADKKAGGAKKTGHVNIVRRRQDAADATKPLDTGAEAARKNEAKVVAKPERGDLTRADLEGSTDGGDDEGDGSTEGAV